MNNTRKYATLAVVALKSTKIIKALKLLKFLKFAKPLITIITITISLFAYSFAYSLSLGIMLIALMFVHELGHVAAINRLGLKAGRMIFIPFLGAMISAPKGMNRRQEAIVGIGGPWLGSLFAYLLIVIYYITGEMWFLHAGYLGIILNLFNMIPVSPLDGGKVTQAAGKYFSIVGIVLLIALTLALKNPGLLLIWIIAFYDFHWFSLKLRVVIVTIIELALIVILITGFGIEQKLMFWHILGDVIIGGAVVGILLINFMSNRKATEEIMSEGASRPELNVKDKLTWFLIWFLTSLLLLSNLLALAPKMHNQ